VIIVKVGGSLFDHPRLKRGLDDYLKSLLPAEVKLVAGGGEFVDVLRKLDRIHGLGESDSHLLALRAMAVSAEFLHRLLDTEQLGPRIHVPDASAFWEEDRNSEGSLPATWQVTSDSIAARMAVVYRAERLVLLKSIDIPEGTNWREAAARGWVDEHFLRALAGSNFPVEIINFRRRLDSLAE
jgi:aspartokinase-like uncharacterized kinase